MVGHKHIEAGEDGESFRCELHFINPFHNTLWPCSSAATQYIVVGRRGSARGAHNISDLLINDGKARGRAEGKAPAKKRGWIGHTPFIIC